VTEPPQAVDREGSAPPTTGVDASLQPPAPPAITQPCVIDGMPEDIYHGDPVRRPARSLSHSGFKTLTERCPARFVYEREHGRPGKREFDVGSGAHTLVLGNGPEFHVINARDYRTKKAQDERDKARAANKTPLLIGEFETVTAMATALRTHHTAGSLFAPGRGHAERSVFWFDYEFGIWRRARFDWCVYLPDGRLAIVDYKSGTTANPAELGRPVFNFGYYTQRVYYEDAARALDLAEDVVFLLVFQEKDPPYLTSVVELDDEAREWGRLKVRAGLELYAECATSDYWPDYTQSLPGGIARVSLPRYAGRSLEDEWRAGSLREFRGSW